jgi:hypothetical protein
MNHSIFSHHSTVSHCIVSWFRHTVTRVCDADNQL